MSSTKKPSIYFWPLVGAVMLAATLQLGGRIDKHAEAGIRSGDKKEERHFKSGGERSEAILVEISTTLKRIDQRLARIESAAVKNANLKSGNSQGSQIPR